MTKHFLAQLAKFEDFEFNLLEHHMAVARMVRDTMSKNGIDEKTMAEHIGVRVKDMKKVIAGAYEYDLMLVSKLNAYQQQIAANNAKLRIEAESIQFADYKYKHPHLGKSGSRPLRLSERAYQNAA